MNNNNNNQLSKFEIIKSIQKDKLYRVKLRLATEQLIKIIFKNANLLKLNTDLKFVRIICILKFKLK